MRSLPQPPKKTRQENKKSVVIRNNSPANEGLAKDGWKKQRDKMKKSMLATTIHKPRRLRCKRSRYIACCTFPKKPAEEPTTTCPEKINELVTISFNSTAATNERCATHWSNANAIVPGHSESVGKIETRTTAQSLRTRHWPTSGTSASRPQTHQQNNNPIIRRKLKSSAAAL